MPKRRQLPARYRRDEQGRFTLRPEWIRADLAMNIGLIVLGVYILQAFISTGVSDVPGRIAIIAWVVAIPQLAVLSLMSQTMSSYKYFSYPWYLSVARSLGLNAALLGFGAAVWRLWVPAALVLVASGLFAGLVYTFAYGRLEQENPADER